MAQILLLDLQLVFPLDSLVSSHPISVEVDHPKKIKQIFDRISYSKVLVTQQNQSRYIKTLLRYMYEFIASVITRSTRALFVATRQPFGTIYRSFLSAISSHSHTEVTRQHAFSLAQHSQPLVKHSFRLRNLFSCSNRSILNCARFVAICLTFAYRLLPMCFCLIRARQ